MTATRIRWAAVVLAAMGVIVAHAWAAKTGATALVPTLAFVVFMLTTWMMEVLPLGVVSCVPALYAGLTGLLPWKAALKSYVSPIVLLFLGGFLVALALERWQVHRRSSLTLLRAVGRTPRTLVLGVLMAAFGLSMWISNTATAMMLLPTVAAIAELTDGPAAASSTPSRRGLGTPLLLAIMYGANIGGVATIVGTAPNVAFRAYYERAYGSSLSFFDWLLVGLPLALLVAAVAYGILCLRTPRVVDKLGEARASVGQALAELGAWRSGERRVVAVFVFVALAWSFQLLLRDAVRALGLGIPVTDDSIAALAGVLVLTIPSGEPGKRYAPLVPLTALKRLPWDVLLLFGGGLTIAAAMDEAGALAWLAQMLKGLDGWPAAAVILLMVGLAIFVSELLSNVALVTVFAPIACVAGERLGVQPIVMGLAVSFGASLAFMLPIGTPPNAIVYGSGHVRLGTMARTGFVLNVASALVIWLVCLTLVPLVFGP